MANALDALPRMTAFEAFTAGRQARNQNALSQQSLQAGRADMRRQAVTDLARGVIGSDDPETAYQGALQQLATIYGPEAIANLPQTYADGGDVLSRMYAEPEKLTALQQNIAGLPENERLDAIRGHYGLPTTADRQARERSNALLGSLSGGAAQSSGNLPLTGDRGPTREALSRAESATPTFMSLLDQTEGAGSYDTLFAHAEDGPFAGVDITDMTLAELEQFSDPRGDYASFVKGQVGRVATPMGRGQIVGTTLRNAAREMGLPPDTKFTPEVQDDMIAHLAQKRLAGASTKAEKRRALRAEWHGLRNVPDAQLDMAIAELEGQTGGTQVASAGPAQGTQVASVQAGGMSSAAGAQPPQGGQEQVPMGTLLQIMNDENIDPKAKQAIWEVYGPKNTDPVDWQRFKGPDDGQYAFNPRTREVLPLMGPVDEAPTEIMREAEAMFPDDPQKQREYVQNYREKSGVNVNVGPSGVDYGNPGKGLVWARDQEGNIKLDERGAPVAIPFRGGPAWQDQQAEAERETGRMAEIRRAGGTVVQDLGRALEMFDQMHSGSGVVGANARVALSQIAGTAEYNVNQFIQSALSNVGLDRLQQMRENSPTGGALGQVPVQQQKRLEQVLGSLELGQKPSVIKENMKRVQNIYFDIMFGSKEERAAAVKAGKMTSEENKEIESLYHDLSFDEVGRKKTDSKRFRYNPETGELE